jgi:hypothetical protein
MKLLIVTDRQPWLDDVPLEQGAEVDVVNEDTIKALLDNGFAVEVVAEVEPEPAKVKKPKIEVSETIEPDAGATANV